MSSVAVKPQASQVPVAATPSNYTPSNSSVEGHLSGIDTALAGGGAVSSVNGETGAVVLDATEVDIASLTPTNYTPSDSSIEGHLSGINSALGSFITISEQYSTSFSHTEDNNGVDHTVTHNLGTIHVLVSVSYDTGTEKYQSGTINANGGTNYGYIIHDLQPNSFKVKIFKAQANGGSATYTWYVDVLSFV